MGKSIIEGSRLIERVAAGLRNMRTEPDYLLFFDDYYRDFVYDKDKICGIKVLHCPYTMMSLSYQDFDCPCIPVWNDEGAGAEIDIFGFGREFSNY